MSFQLDFDNLHHNPSKFSNENNRSTDIRLREFAERNSIVPRKRKKSAVRCVPKREEKATSGSDPIRHEASLRTIASGIEAIEAGTQIKIQFYCRFSGSDNRGVGRI